MNYDNTSQTNHNTGNNNIREGDANKATKKALQNKSHVKIILSDPTEANITNNSKNKTNPIIIATLIIIVISFDLLKHNAKTYAFKKNIIKSIAQIIINILFFGFSKTK